MSRNSIFVQVPCLISILMLEEDVPSTRKLLCRSQHTKKDLIKRSGTGTTQAIASTTCTPTVFLYFIF